MTIVQNPQFKVPDWMLNRKKDTKDGVLAVRLEHLDMKPRRRSASRRSAPTAVFATTSSRVRGQRTKTTGRKGRTVGVSKKKG